MRELVLTARFRRSFRKFVRRDAGLQKRIEDILGQMERDLFAADLSTHKLSGELFGLWACSCGYDCRIVFSIEKESEKEMIVLIDVGTHDEVY